MNLKEAIKNRRSIAQLLPEAVPRGSIEQLLELAIWAPNHKRTEPWRFAVFTGAGRENLAQSMRENYRLDHPEAEADELAGPGEKYPARVLAAPVTIVVTSVAGPTEILTLENYAATAIAVQHILLGAHALGLATYWRTGEAAYTAPRNAVKELIAAEAADQIVAFILLGRPAVPAAEGRRTPFAEKAQWFE